jgi:hypothetical protein
MEDIKVIQLGLGSVGKGVVNALIQKSGIVLVGAADPDKDKAGKDLGEVVGARRKLGITVSGDADSLVANTGADVVIHTTSCRHVETLYSEVNGALQQGMNVITALSQASDLYLYNPEIAARIEKLARANGVTFLGIGSTQLAARLVLTLTEACTTINKVKFTIHADVSNFGKESNRDELGIGLTKKGYENKKAKGNEHESSREEARLIAEHLGWRLDEIRQKIEPSYGDDGRVFALNAECKGIKDNNVKIEYIYKYMLDPRHEYSHEIIVDGIPSINAFIKYSPDRGLVGTIAPIVNAIPKVVSADPGILKMADLDICSIWEDARVNMF